MPAKATPDQVDVFVVIPRGSRAKVELDKKSGHIRLDRILHSSMRYPADDGFVIDTLGNDGDPLDALVIVEEPTFPGCAMPARPIGTLFMRDAKGEDEKILAVPTGDPRFAEIRTLKDLAPHWRKEIETVFATSKSLESDDTEVRGWPDEKTAWRVIESARRRQKRR
jgi:inorganic pyrophosphatase